MKSFSLKILFRFNLCHLSIHFQAKYDLQKSSSNILWIKKNWKLFCKRKEFQSHSHSHLKINITPFNFLKLSRHVSLKICLHTLCANHFFLVCVYVWVLWVSRFFSFEFLVGVFDVVFFTVSGNKLKNIRYMCCLLVLIFFLLFCKLSL